MGKSILLFMPAVLAAAAAAVATTPYAIVDTGQDTCFSAQGSEVSCIGSGQDGAYSGNTPRYTDNGDGTVTDNVTLLVWQKSPDSNKDGQINVSDKMTQSGAETYCSNLVLGGAEDWRLPDIKTIYSLMNFSGEDVSGPVETGATPFIETDYFEFRP